MDLDTMLDEAAPARRVRLDGPDSPAAVSLYRRIVTQPPAAARRRYRLAVPVIAVDPARIDVPPGQARFSAGEVINYTVYAASGVVNSIGAVPSAAA